MAQEAEDAGLDTFWLADHFFYEAPNEPRVGQWEAFTFLSAIAAATSRIQLGPMSTMLSEIVVQMLASRDTLIAGPSAPGTDPLDAARKAGAQLLVVQSEPGPSGTIEQIFAQPDLAILMISGDGRQGRLVSFAQQPVTLDRDSMAALVLQVAGHA